jgi:hypothetical protein
MRLRDRALDTARRRRRSHDTITAADRGSEGRGRVALITGASAGIGRSVADLLAAKGYDVVLVARRAERLEAIADELRREYFVQAHVITADLCDPAAPAHIRDVLAERGIEVDVLVNNAGYDLMGELLDNPWSEQLKIIHLLGLSTVELCRHLLPHMVEQGWGRIINVTSVAGMMSGAPSMSLYCASKAFVHRFTEGIAGEYAARGVHATVSVPGSTDTEIFHSSGLWDYSQSNATFQLAMMSPMTVARQAYDGSMRGKKVVVHGWHHRIWAQACVHAPAPLRYALTSWFSRISVDAAAAS